MKIGDRVTVTRGGQIIKSKVTYQDYEKACGYVELSPKEEADGNIVGLKLGWFRDYWLVSLDNGTVIRVPVRRNEQ